MSHQKSADLLSTRAEIICHHKQLKKDKIIYFMNNLKVYDDG